MEDFKVQHCKFCLTTIDGANYEAIDILDVLLLKLDFDDYSRHLMCNVCKPKLSAALKFKSTCLDTNDAIVSYASNATTLPINLTDIYMKQGGCKYISDDVKICHLCIQPIEDASEFKSLNDGQIDMMQKFIPEMDISIIKEPVMCKLCHGSLAEHCNFLTKCWDSEENNGTISNEQVVDAPFPVFVKIEDVDIKIEDEEQSNRIECMEANYGGIKIKSEIEGEEVFEDDFKRHLLEHKNPSEVQMYKCDTCNYQTKLKGNLKKHMIIHKDPSEVQMYKCDICNYHTRSKGNLKTHLKIHKDPSEVQMYKCNICNYQTYNKRNLNRHMLRHKDPSEVEMHKCEHCDFQTKDKGNLKGHMLRHKHPSEVRMYKCETCDYETREKGNLRRHMLIHRDPSRLEMYKCQHCNYESKHQIGLKRHMRVHGAKVTSAKRRKSKLSLKNQIQDSYYSRDIC